MSTSAAVDEIIPSRNMELAEQIFRNISQVQDEAFTKWSANKQSKSQS